ncbi:ankyrin [Penicillium angulare]|uniref:ankyrin n=1 Tax=Penicillium angulare TaxID=116970 RepID=UPI0025421077|nr:ankyrin [Penicillium angulare]KAJ5281960.1 ankyrin [Penicillium angulare]
MDPLSISLGIAGVLPLIAGAITTAKEYIDNVKCAKESIATLVIELEALQSNVENLHDLLKGDSIRTSSIQFQESSVLRTCSAACETRLRSLCKKLAKDANRKGSRLLWPFTEKEYQKLIQEIRNFTNWMGFALSIEGCRLLSRTSDDVLELMGQQLEQFRTIQTVEAHTAQILDFVEEQRHTNKVNIEKEAKISIFNWISNGKHDQKHQLVQSSRVQNTGKWILQKDEFIQWRNNSSASNVLVCYGIQGSGKTNLASIIIDELLDSSSSENSPVAYFYFDHQDQSSQSTPLVLRCILRQLLQSLPTIPSAVLELYEKGGRNGQIPVHDSERLLTDLASNLDCVYLVFDGLDESEHRTTCLQSIQNLIRSPKVRFLVTCRPHILDIANIFQQHPKLEIEAHEDDLQMCLRQELNAARIYDIADHEFVSRLIWKLTQNAEGMFLLPILQLRTILKEPTIGEMEDRIADMSYSLSDAFSDTISRIQRLPESRSRLGMGALMWLSHTPRAMTVLELSDALAARSVGNTVNVRYRPYVKTILECCQGLATVDVEGYVRLAHYAIQEYLRENATDLFPKAKATIAVTCLRYLVLEDFHGGPWWDDSEIEDKMEMYPFLTWATVYWGQFTRVTETDAEVWSALLVFFSCPVATAISNQVRQYSQGKRFEYYDSEECKSFSALHHASRHGLKRAVCELLDSGTYDVNELTEMGSTPVIHAAAAGHVQTTRTLLDHGANPRLRNWYGDALHCAIQSDKTETVRELIRWGVDPNTIQNDKQTYLGCAVDGDCAGAFAVLVELGADIKLQSAIGHDSHIFFTAALWGCGKIVVLMLERGWADIEMRNPRGQTALHFAVLSEDPTTVRMIMKAGANIDEMDNAGHTALDYAEVAKNKTILRLLLASKPWGTCLQVP